MHADAALDEQILQASGPSGIACERVELLSEKANAKAAKTKRGKKARSPDDEPIQMIAEES